MYILHMKPDKHDTCTLMTSRTWKPFMLTQQSWTESLLLRKGLPTQSPTRRLTDPYIPTQFLSPTTIKEVEKVKHLSTIKLHRFPPNFSPPISLTCDQYVQYLLVVTNSLVFNQHRWGLQPWRYRLSSILS
jgi:hypothetical protein